MIFLTKEQSADWIYKTNPNKGHCLGFKNGNCLWNKGKAMGGSSSINAMLYTRGHPNDFTNWSKDGNPEWIYESVKQNFENIEKLMQSESENESDTTSVDMYNALIQSWTELGFNYNHSKYHNTEAQIGIGTQKLSIKKGKRFNLAKVALNTVKNNVNLKVMKNTIVQRILINPATKKAFCVQIRHRNGNIMEIKATMEVMLSAGSIATPQLLLLSGIGPKFH